MSATQPTLAGFRSETTVVGGRRLHSWIGGRVPAMVRRVAENVEAVTLFDCGHFVPEERPTK